MRIYLVDTENTGTYWTELLPQLNETDQLILFTTQNSPYLSPEKVEQISKKEIKVFHCATGKNALDFQLSSYLGLLMVTNENATFFIVSDDKGFDCLLYFWKKESINQNKVKRLECSNVRSFHKKEDCVTPEQVLTKEQIQQKAVLVLLNNNISKNDSIYVTNLWKLHNFSFSKNFKKKIQSKYSGTKSEELLTLLASIA